MILNETDRQIVRALAADARLSTKALAAQIGLSAPATAERVRRLQEKGVIRAFTITVDPRALGYTLQAIVHVKPLPGRLKEVEELLLAIPQLCECDKVTGDDCFIARAYLRGIEDLEVVFKEVMNKAETRTSIVKSQPLKRRLPGF